MTTGERRWSGVVTLLPAEPEAEAFFVNARCRKTGNVNAMFPSNGHESARAKLICAQCEVTEQCLYYAIKYRIDQGVWGGVDEFTRLMIRRGRRRANVDHDTRTATLVTL